MTTGSCSRIEQVFPDYFSRFKMPEGAKEESITVYRACKSGKCDRESFLPSYEENGYKLPPMADPSDPGQYSLSTFENPKDMRRFAFSTSDIRPPYSIAIGNTHPRHGLVQRTRERTKRKTSHVDWWLYKDARPYEEFEIIEDFEAYYEDYRRTKEAK